MPHSVHKMQRVLGGVNMVGQDKYGRSVLVSVNVQMLTTEAQYGRDKHSSLPEIKINLNGYTFRKRSCFMVIFLAPFTKVQGVVAVTLMSMWTLYI